MKAIMLSIKPKYVSMILNKTKTIEVRKVFPKDYRGWVYIYCTKGKQYITRGYYFNEGIIDRHRRKYYVSDEKIFSQEALLNGKVVACFYCDKVEEIKFGYYDGAYFYTDSLGDDELYLRSCLDFNDLESYFKGNTGYAIHINEVKIFDKPKELSEFKHYVRGKCMTSKCHFQKDYMCDVECELGLTKAPQNLCYVEVIE